MVNKDVTHQKMKRRLENPRIILLDCPLEYKKGESQTDVELTAETDFTKVGHFMGVCVLRRNINFFRANLCLIFHTRKAPSPSGIATTRVKVCWAFE